jgi:hypothetical protein
LASCLLLSVAACGDYKNVIIANAPWTAPIIGGRATPTPFALQTGSIRGFVFGADGPKQPIPLAFVTTGSISTFAANPTDPAFDGDEPDDGKTIFGINHDFGDGKGAVLCERRPRKFPLKPVDDSPDALFDAKYVYLRPGEFFLEGVPDGITNLTASFGNVNSSPSPVTVYANTTVDDANLNLLIPTPVVNEDGSTPKVVEWTGLTPSTGVTLDVQTKDSTDPNGVSHHDVTITYKPDPPDVAVELKAPPGSGGTVIKQISISYVYNTQGQNFTLPVPPIPISPEVVSAAQATAFGPPAILTIPVGSKSLATIFSDQDPTKQPGLVIADINFIGDDGFLVQAKNLEALKVSVPLRAL